MGMMTEDQIKGLLAVAAAYDDRKPDRAQLAAWSAVVANLPHHECRQAIISYYSRPHTRRIQPGDVRELVTTTRGDRVARSGWSTQRPPMDPDDPVAYQRWLREGAEGAAAPDGARQVEAAPDGAPSERVRDLLAQARDRCRQARRTAHTHEGDQ